MHHRPHPFSAAPSARRAHPQGRTPAHLRCLAVAGAPWPLESLSDEHQVLRPKPLACRWRPGFPRVGVARAWTRRDGFHLEVSGLCSLDAGSEPPWLPD